MSSVHPRLGALKDPVDTRDFSIRKLIVPVKLPVSVDYEQDMCPVKNQGNRGACVAFASAAVKEFQERKQRKGKINYDFSEEWIYRQIMVAGGGAYPREAFKAFIDAGVPREKYMPYQPNESDEEKLPFAPTNAAIRNAKYYKAQAFARLNTVEEMKQSLAINGPFLIGVDWHDAWFTPAEKIGEYPIIRSTSGSSVGGHAVAIVGYNDTIQAFKLRNSWGEEWGRKGYAYISYDVIRNNLFDAWATLDVNSDNVKSQLISEMKEKVDA